MKLAARLALAVTAIAGTVIAQDEIPITPVPEPSTVTMIVIAGAALGVKLLYDRRKR